SATEAEKQAASHRYTELNAAYNCLREAKVRLTHLLELELGARPPEVRPIPPATMDLFNQVNQLCREADVFLGGKTTATSPLLKVQMFEKGLALTEKLNARLQQLSARRAALTEQIRLLKDEQIGAVTNRSTIVTGGFGMLTARLKGMETILNFDSRNSVFASRLRHHGGGKKSIPTLPIRVGPLARRSS